MRSRILCITISSSLNADTNKKKAVQDVLRSLLTDFTPSIADETIHVLYVKVLRELEEEGQNEGPTLCFLCHTDILPVLLTQFAGQEKAEIEVAKLISTLLSSPHQSLRQQLLLQSMNSNLERSA